MMKVTLERNLYERVQVFLKTKSLDILEEIVPELYRVNKHSIVRQLIKISIQNSLYGELSCFLIQRFHKSCMYDYTINSSAHWIYLGKLLSEAACEKQHAKRFVHYAYLDIALRQTIEPSNIHLTTEKDGSQPAKAQKIFENYQYVHAVGDSHVAVLAAILENAHIKTISGATSYSLTKNESKTMSSKRIKDYMRGIKGNFKTLVVFSFGEIDIRCGIPKYIRPNTLKETILGSIKPLLETIELYKTDNITIAVMLPNPPSTYAYKSYRSFSTRHQIWELYVRELTKELSEKNIPCFSAISSYDESFSNYHADGVHLANYPYLTEETKDSIEEKLIECLFSSNKTEQYQKEKLMCPLHHSGRGYIIDKKKQEIQCLPFNTNINKMDIAITNTILLSLESFFRASDIHLSISLEYQSSKITEATMLIQDDNDKLHKFNLGVMASKEELASQTTYFLPISEYIKSTIWFKYIELEFDGIIKPRLISFKTNTKF